MQRNKITSIRCKNFVENVNHTKYLGSINYNIFEEKKLFCELIH